MNLAGFPAQISLSGILPVTTLNAPTTEFSPITDPLRIILSAPINAHFFIITG